MKLQSLFAMAGLCLYCLTVQAETTSEPIIVTATRTAQTADETLASVTVITRQQIEASQARDVADLLRLHAGLELGRNGGPGQTTSLFMRGTDSNHTLVLIDGVRINPATIGGAPFQNINPALIDHIEIVRGPRSTLYGSDAIGGVIQIFTRRKDQGITGTAYLGGGSDSTYSAGGSIQGGKNGFRGGIDAGYLESDGFPTRTTSDLDRGHDNLNANLYAGYGNELIDVELSHWRAEGNTEYLDFFLAPLDQDFDNSVTALTLRATPKGIWSPTVKLSHYRDDIQQQQSSDFVRTERDTLDWQNDFVVNDHHLLTAGVYVAREDTESLSFGTGFDEETDIHAIFVQDNMRYGNHSLLLAGRYTDHEDFGDHNTWNIAYGFEVQPATRVFASVGTAFRAPDATDRFGFGGNPDLDAETSRNYEIGVQHRFGKNQSLRVTAFHNSIDDLITFNDPDGFLGPIVGKNENIEEAKIRGIEAQYSLQHRALSLHVEAIIQDPENEDTGRKLARRAKRSITANANYDFGRFDAGVEWLASSDRKDSDFSDAELGGYGLVNINVRIPVNKEFSLQGKIENLFDKNYFLADKFNSQDRAWYLTIRYQPKTVNLL